jgi:dsDNA-binding SOS-regulon protein
MKKILSLITLLAVCFAVKAQNDKDTSVKKVAVSICNCLEKNHMENAKDQAEMQSIFLQCMLDSAASVMGQIAMNAENGDFQQAGQEIGQKIAMELVKMNCKPFMQMSMKLAQSGGSITFGNEGNNKTDESIKSVDGVVTKVEERDFLYITVKTSAGRDITMIYLDYVDNSDDWVKNAAVKLKDKKVTAQYVEKEVYMPKIKDFSDVKMLKELRIKKD